LEDLEKAQDNQLITMFDADTVGVALNEIELLVKDGNKKTDKASV